MHHIHLLHWLMDFIGVNNTYDTFSTKMYNFWSGFGGGLIQFSLLGVILAMYQHYIKHNAVVEFMRRKSHLENDTSDKSGKPKPKARS